MNGMLSRSRIISIFGLVIGVAMLVAGMLLPGLLAVDQPIPLGLKRSTLTLRDNNAKIGPNYQGLGAKGVIEAPVVRQFNMTLGQPASEEKAAARVGVSTRRGDVDDDLKALLDAQIFSFHVDRYTGAAIKGEGKVADTPATPSADVVMGGQWAKFPDNTERRTYDYFDVTLRKALPAHFVRESEVTAENGESVPVYIFRQDIEPESVKQQYDGFRNEITDPGTGQKAELFHGGFREITVEPMSGYILGVEEGIKDVYMAGGKEVQPLLEFHGQTTGNTRDEMLLQAREIWNLRTIHTWKVALLVSGAIVTAVSLIVALRPDRRSRRDRGEWRETHTGGRVPAADTASGDDAVDESH